MIDEIKQRIEQVKAGQTPEGYIRKTKIGIIPKEWEVKPLRKILYPEERKVVKPSKGYWRLGLRSHAKGTFHEYIEDPASIGMDELFLVKQNDLVVNITFAWEHAVAVANKDDENKLVSHRFPTYAFLENSYPMFYKYVVAQRWFKEMLDNISPGGAGRNRVMNRQAFLKLDCIAPPLVEQKKIAEILATHDKVIKLKERLIEEKKRQKKWLMQKLLNPESGVRLPGFKDDWEEIKFGELFDFEGGLSASRDELSDTGICYLHYGDIHKSNKNYIDVDKEFNILPKLNINIESLNNKKKLLSDGDVVFVDASEDYEGTCKYVVIKNERNIPFISGLHTIIAKSKNQKLTREFKRFCFENHAIKKQMAFYATGISVLGISKRNIEKIKILVPSLSEQAAIADILYTADREIALLEKELEETKVQKKALMQLLLTGIVRVNDQLAMIKDQL